MFCSICSKSYKNITVLKTHYTSAIHKRNLAARLTQPNSTDSSKQPIVLANTTPQGHHNNITSNNPPQLITTKLNLDDVINNLPDIDNNQIEEEITKYECPGCSKEYAQKPSLYRHQKKCSFYKEAYKLSSKTQIDVKIASKLLKQHYLSKTIPHLRLEQDSNNILHTGPITNNNTTINNNNINIMVGNWETLNFIRPFLHENISHLYTKENRLEIIKSGNNAVNVVIKLIYDKPENKNMYRYNERRNYVKTPDINGEIVSYPANEAFAKLATVILDITDDIMTNSKDIILEYPQYQSGIDAYALTNNWLGEGGNERYKEYEKKIEMSIETSHKSSESNIIRFENEKRKILLNGGVLDFNKKSINNLDCPRSEVQIQKTITALKEVLSKSEIC
jgi:hypothetical protein